MLQRNITWEITMRHYLAVHELVLFRSVLQLLLTANVFPSSLICVILMEEAISFSETSLFTRATLRHIEEGILYCNAVKSCNPTITGMFAATAVGLSCLSESPCQ
jgi:hypothetical protein